MPGIKNLDNTQVIQDKDLQIKNMQAAFEEGDAKAVAERIVLNMESNMQHIQDMMNNVINESQQAQAENWDAQVLASRGVRVLTNDEKKFYNAAIEVKSFNETHTLMPPTIFERVFEELEKEHPLLSLVNFQTTGAVTQWVVRKEGTVNAFWGDVCDEIKEMIDEGFETLDQGMFKLSGFLVVCKAMFELGPEWLDKYVRTFMKEVVADELERVIVTGTGKKQPIGMIKDLSADAVVKDGIYPDKAKVKLKDFTPKTIGKEILAPTTKGGTKRYTGVTLIVNPLDYAVKFFPIGAKRKDDGTWTYDNFGVPGLTIVQSPAVPLDTVISGKPKDYFMGVAAEQRLISDDSIRLIEDQRLYLIRQLANGRPLDADSFTVFDISELNTTTDPSTPN
ncbi:phage major capsid protein [Bacillus anthracis]|nr:phage major capsid protein [Bacillus anthracis]